MCQAMEDTREEGRAEGREEGREEALAVAFRKSVELLMDLGCSRENAEKLAAAKFAEDSNATVK